MKKQKIRGTRRRHRAINKWVHNNLPLRYDLLEKYREDHCDIVVHPWCDLSLLNSVIPRPKGKTRNLMVDGLVKIYYAWKDQLDKLKQPYYLKIWLYHPRFELSRVVCAVDERINYYENLLNESYKKDLPINLLKNSNLILNSFSWKIGIDNEYYSDNDLREEKDYASTLDYLETKRWFTKIMSKPHTTIPYKYSEDNIIYVYCFTQGNIWIGETNKTNN